MSLRYVVLHHTDVPQPHFDLMIEASPGSELMTWRCDSWPMDDGAELKRIGDHRRAYLDYEGAVSGNRGHVKRVAAGLCELQENSLNRFLLRVDRGVNVTLRPLEGDRWIVESPPKSRIS